MRGRRAKRLSHRSAKRAVTADAEAQRKPGNVLFVRADTSDSEMLLRAPTLTLLGASSTPFAAPEHSNFTQACPGRVSDLGELMTPNEVRLYGYGVYATFNVQTALLFAGERGSIVQFQRLVQLDFIGADGHPSVKDRVHPFPKPAPLLPLLTADFVDEDKWKS